MSLLASLAALPFAASAESVIFNADFTSPNNPASAAPSVITPTSTSWFGFTSKASGTITASDFGPTIKYTGSSGVLEMANRFTPATSAMNLASTGDYIQAEGSFYTTNSTQVAVGLYNSGGIDPLVTLPNGTAAVAWGGTATAGATGGTLGWKGYRGRMDVTLTAGVPTGSTAANIAARAAQTASPTFQSYDLLATGSSAFATPGSIGVGTTTASTTSIPLDQGGGLLYNFTYKIERLAGDVLKITYSINSADNSAHYSVTGTTSAATALPSAITSTFDALAIGVRGTTTSPSFQVSSFKVTGRNADITKITTQPIAQSIPNGGAGSLTVGASGTGPFTYQWYKDSAILSGATSATYNISSGSAADNGNYYVVVSNAFGSEASSTVAVNVSSVSAPAFTTQPVATNVDAGSTLTLTTVVTGVPTPTYQWFLDNNPISGATSATYTVATATTANVGSYKLVATNSQGSATSDIVAVTVNTAAPAITVQPTPVTVNVGAAINLSVTTTGLPPPSYQWYKDTVAISGATAATYGVSNAATANAGSYTVTATNPSGSVTSNPVAVVVNVVAPSLVTQPPAALTINSGERMVITAAYSGSAPLAYQWYKGATLISGATGTSYVIPTASGADAGTYHVVVTNEGGNATSIDTVVTVQNASETSVFATDFSTDTLNNPATPITSTSTSWFVLSNRLSTNSSVGDDAATAEVVDPRLLLTWNTTSSSSAVETAARFAATPVALSTAGEYIRMRATFKSSNLRVLAFGLYNSGGVSPVALDGSVGGSLMSTAFSDAFNTGTQNWVGYRSALTDASATGDAGTRPAQTGAANNRAQDLIYPTGSTGAAFGEPAGVAIGLQPGLTNSVTFTANTTYTLVYTVALTASNQYTITYGLYAGATDSGTPLCTTSITSSVAAALPSAVTTSFDSLAIGLRNIDGTSNPTLVFTSLSVVKGAAVTSVAPAITTQPTAQSVTVGAPLTLAAAASGTPTPTYQWYLDNNAISGATSATYSVGSASLANAGSYKVTATNSAGSATSNSVTVTVTTPYQAWSASKGLTTGVNDGVSQDPDNDGANNLLEFAFGGNPLAASTSGLPVVTISGGNLVLTYDIQDAALASYTITPESSTDLAAWNTVAHGVAGATIVQTVVNSTTSHVVVTVPASGSRTFLRVKVAPTP